MHKLEFESVLYPNDRKCFLAESKSNQSSKATVVCVWHLVVAGDFDAVRGLAISRDVDECCLEGEPHFMRSVRVRRDRHRPEGFSGGAGC